ncbi:MAG: transaldolase [bacterium]
MSDPLADLSAQGVSIWLDDISRERLRSGTLQELIDTKHVVGVTSNPTIFQKAMEKGDAYDEQFKDLAVRGVSLEESVRLLTTFDIRWACDVLRPVFDRTDGKDGRVSIEVDPRIAQETEKTSAEAAALWWLVDRPNVMIKIPATEKSLSSIARSTERGICVNVTLIFSLERYDNVMDAYLTGLEAAEAAGVDLSTVRSVASFFVSRVDTEVDKRLDKIGSEQAIALKGKAGIANAQLAYEHYEKVFSSDRWKALEASGAHPQRPLWASTGVKDPAYDDTMYVVQLTAPNTVNTMPEATLDAVADHGTIAGDAVTGSYAAAQKVLDDLQAVGVDYTEVVELLEQEGVQKFEDAWKQLLEGVQGQLDRAAGR